MAVTTTWAGTRSDAPGESRSILVVEDVHLAYGSVHALDGAQLAVGAGEWVAIDGPSGSGKSTLLQLLAALDHPQRGRICFRGRDLAKDRHLDRYRREDVGIVFQLHNLIPHLHARANVEIAMLGTHLRAATRHAHAAALLDLVRLGTQADRRPTELSGGERQRVAVARALANHPALLLADEPTGNLDPESAQVVVDAFRQRRDSEGTTIVMVTHDDAIAAAADRVVTLDKGRFLT